MACVDPGPPLSLRSPRLPSEIIWIIIEDLLADLSIATCHDSEGVTSPIPLNILVLNRHFHKLVLRAAYHTIILTSLRLLFRFYNTIVNSPHLANFVHNLWIGTPHLKMALDRGRDEWATLDAINYILSKAPMTNLKRLALPMHYALVPSEFAKLGKTIEHITIGGGAVPKLPCNVKTLHIHGSIQPLRVKYLKHGTLRHVVYDLEKPCKPGAIGHVIQELLGDTTTKGDHGLRLELVILPGILTWIEDELSRLTIDSSLEGALVVRVRHSGGDGSGLRRYSYCEEWMGAMRGT